MREPLSLDQVVKVLGYLLAALYISGLIILNSALEHLGLSDFSVLQPRCIAAGLLLAFYMLLDLALVAPLVGASWLALYYVMLPKLTRKTRVRRAILCIVAYFFVQLVVLRLTALLYGSLTPWFSAYEHAGRLDWELLKVWWELFGHRWNFGSAYLVFMAFAVYVWLYVLFSLEIKFERLQFSQQQWILVSLLLLAPVIMIFVFTIPGFARDVYPNLAQSVGGGQPIIARLQLSDPVPLIEDGRTFRRVAEQVPGKDPKLYVLTDPVVVWYQTASYVYVSPLAINSGKVRPIAIDIRSVKVIQQIAQVIQVRNGTAIMAIRNQR
ncbi:hypothetical protein ACM43_12875 [Bradyrhizobium sp. CCBAU 45321]|nr:hypothetical protein [Bradyrhizobium sp. CCBAU 45321]